tara:strand:- start:71 stop:697 length:627 start_codon:yes stop_codon:yes gene_type:complete
MENNPCYQTVLQLLESRIKIKDSALYKHYKAYNPKTIYDIYNVGERLKEYSFKSIFIPWIHFKPINEYTDSSFIERSDSFIEKQVEKINALMYSIKTFGYDPEKYSDKKGGHITGYFLEGKNSKKFYVVSGNHRAATLAALFPDTKIPVIYEESAFLKKSERELMHRESPVICLETYSFKDVDKWFSVRSGFLTEREALEILEVYLNV